MTSKGMAVVIGQPDHLLGQVVGAEDLAAEDADQDERFPPGLGTFYNRIASNSTAISLRRD